MKHNFSFILSKCMAMACIIAGIHMLGAYLEKVLPFGIVSENIGLWTAWAYLGWGSAAFVLLIGTILLLQGTRYSLYD